MIIFRDLNSKLNTVGIRKQLWSLISEDSACDSRVRSCAIDLWKVLFHDAEMNKDYSVNISAKHSDDEDGKRKKKKKKKEKKAKKEKERKEEGKKILSSPENLSWM